MVLWSRWSFYPAFPDEEAEAPRSEAWILADLWPHQKDFVFNSRILMLGFHPQRFRLNSSQTSVASQLVLLVKNLPANAVSQFSHSVMSDSLWPYELQHDSPPCPSPTPGFHPNPCPWSRWCHPTISSSVVPFSFCPQSFPASGSFQMSQLFASGGPKYWSFSFSISPSNEHPGLISFRMD